MAKPGTFEKGKSGNPGGFTKEVREAREAIRLALEAEHESVHEALMSLVREGNATAIIYAHQQLHGKPVERHELTGKDGGSVRHQDINSTRLLEMYDTVVAQKETE